MFHWTLRKHLLRITPRFQPFTRLRFTICIPCLLHDLAPYSTYVATFRSVWTPEQASCYISFTPARITLKAFFRRCPRLFLSFLKISSRIGIFKRVGPIRCHHSRPCVNHNPHLTFHLTPPTPTQTHHHPTSLCPLVRYHNFQSRIRDMRSGDKDPQTDNYRRIHGLVPNHFHSKR